NIAEPRTGLEGKFSLRATTALALLGEDTGAVATYSDAKMADAPVVRLRDRVRVEVDRGLSATRARVALVASARRFENEADTGVPAADLAAQRPRLRAKFDTLAGAVLGSRPAGELAETALSVDRLSSLGDLVRRLGAESRAAAPRHRPVGRRTAPGRFLCRFGIEHERTQSNRVEVPISGKWRQRGIPSILYITSNFVCRTWCLHNWCLHKVTLAC